MPSSCAALPLCQRLSVRACTTFWRSFISLASLRLPPSFGLSWGRRACTVESLSTWASSTSRALWRKFSSSLTFPGQG